MENLVDEDADDVAVLIEHVLMGAVYLKTRNYDREIGLIISFSWYIMKQKRKENTQGNRLGNGRAA